MDNTASSSGPPDANTGSSLLKNGGGGREMPAGLFWARLWASPVPVPLGVLQAGYRLAHMRPRMQWGGGKGVCFWSPVQFSAPSEPPTESSLLRTHLAAHPPSGPHSGSAFFPGPRVGTGWGLGSLSDSRRQPRRSAVRP